mmetsp:Transcript_14111/g.38662  ORF Transcript_14111/g.38662 Transcript_14111/m.38662 type:complete len:443 (-) Transcript_14111:571-1899(-)
MMGECGRDLLTFLVQKGLHTAKLAEKEINILEDEVLLLRQLQMKEALLDDSGPCSHVAELPEDRLQVLPADGATVVVDVLAEGTEDGLDFILAVNAHQVEKLGPVQEPRMITVRALEEFTHDGRVGDEPHPQQGHLKLKRVDFAILVPVVAVENTRQLVVFPQREAGTIDDNVVYFLEVLFLDAGVRRVGRDHLADKLLHNARDRRDAEVAQHARDLRVAQATIAVGVVFVEQLLQVHRMLFRVVADDGDPLCFGDERGCVARAERFLIDDWLLVPAHLQSLYEAIHRHFEIDCQLMKRLQRSRVQVRMVGTCRGVGGVERHWRRLRVLIAIWMICWWRGPFLLWRLFNNLWRGELKPRVVRGLGHCSDDLAEILGQRRDRYIFIPGRIALSGILVKTIFVFVRLRRIVLLAFCRGPLRRQRLRQRAPFPGRGLVTELARSL